MFAQSRRIKFNFEKDKPPREFLLQPTATAAGAGEKKGGGKPFRSQPKSVWYFTPTSVEFPSCAATVVYVTRIRNY